MAVPKRKSSRARQKTRAASHRWHAPKLNSCSECGAAVPSHIVCPTCGTYKGRKIIQVAEIA
ncbi:MAG: 50S ribosomal protein L32 [Verrucomicrobiaceae bacterium]|jgi:large subunit ribosomal protein L32|nr:MAG: 50S ribosomal protein L32 [Verrucomicrobiaceae bacterium]